MHGAKGQARKTSMAPADAYYRVAKVSLLRAALAYAHNPSTGQTHTLIVAAKEFERAREAAGIVIPVDLEVTS